MATRFQFVGNYAECGAKYACQKCVPSGVLDQVAVVWAEPETGRWLAVCGRTKMICNVWTGNNCSNLTANEEVINIRYGVETPSERAGRERWFNSSFADPKPLRATILINRYSNLDAYPSYLHSSQRSTRWLVYSSDWIQINWYGVATRWMILVSRTKVNCI